MKPTILLQLFLVAALCVAATGCGTNYEQLLQRDPQVPTDVLVKAGESDNPDLVAPLIDLLKMRNARGREGLGDDRAVEVVISLGKRRVHPAVPVLIIALRDDDEYTVRYHAAGSLGLIGGRKAMKALLLCVQNENEELNVREEAESALAHMTGRTVSKNTDFETRVRNWELWAKNTGV